MSRSSKPNIWKDKWKDAARAAILRRNTRNINNDVKYVLGIESCIDSMTIDFAASPPYTGMTICNAINSYDKDKAFSIDTLEKMIKDNLALEQQGFRGSGECDLIFPLPLDDENDWFGQQIDVLGDKFTFVRWNELRDYHPDVDFVDFEYQRSILDDSDLRGVSSTAFAVVTGHASENESLEDVKERLIESFCALCGLIEIVLTEQEDDKILVDRHERYAHFVYPPFFFSVNNKVVGNIHLLNSSPRRLHTSTITSLILLRCETLLNGASECDRSLWSIIRRLLSLYSQAVNEEFFHSTFLGLWNVIEEINRAGKVHASYTDTERLLRYLAFMHLGEEESGRPQLDAVLTHCSNTRNSIVHYGNRFDGLTREIRFIKTICGKTLVWMISNANYIGSKECLEMLWELARNFNNREQIAEVIRKMPDLFSMIDLHASKKSDLQA